MTAVSPLVFVLLLLGAAMAASVLAVWSLADERRNGVRRMRTIASDAATARVTGETSRPLRRRRRSRRALAIALRIVNWLKLFGSQEAVVAKVLLAQAGIRAENALGIYLSLRLFLPGVFGAIVLIDTNLLHVLPIGEQWHLLAAATATFAGYYAPKIYLRNLTTRRQAELRKSLPDGIDLLVICVEAGASLNEAFGRVGRELARGSPALSEEFSITAAELAFLPVRRVAFENLLSRTGLPALRSVVTTLHQSERFGTPIAQSLRVLSAEFRDQRMMAASEKAAKLPVMLTVPMMIFILPVLFIVLLGPAVLTIMDSMGSALQ